MPINAKERSNLVFLALLIPFGMACFSWQFFPVLVQRLDVLVFDLQMKDQAASPLWSWTILFFYTWYTFLAIAAAGTWAILTAIARSYRSSSEQLDHPFVSFVVPARNEERNVDRCVGSLYACTRRYSGPCEIIVVDDGSTDYTYEVAWSTIQMNRSRHPHIRAKVIRHSVNLGKIEALKTGVSASLGRFIAVVDADSWWSPETLSTLVDYLLSNGKKAVTGYVHPSDGGSESSLYVTLQQLEYSQGLGISRHAQSLANSVLVVSGAIGLYDANVLRGILFDKNIDSVTEDLEITLEMHEMGAGVGYIGKATSSTVAPSSFTILWRQRLRWFSGWLHNTLSIHKGLLLKRSWLTLLIWYSYIFEYFGAFLDLAAFVAFPFLLWFAPDRLLFVAGLLFFVPYTILIGVVNQSIALKFAYGEQNHHELLYYTPFYPILWIINVFARITSTLEFAAGHRGEWQDPETRSA